MKKILLLLSYLLCITSVAFAQSQGGTWTWMKGDTLSVYGTQGIPDDANNPLAVQMAIGWTDLNGNFWLYGGINYDSAATQSDLWKFNPATNQWTWVKGPGYLSNAIPPAYGTKGVAATTNSPGSRYRAACWVDNSGDFWLFGGTGTGFCYSDLWKYHIATNEWTWMAGPDSRNVLGTYGTEGVSSPANNPGARYCTNATWTDNAGNLWLFGGDDVNNVNSGFNDLWKYTISTNQWTWMKGFNGDLPPDYGHHGVKGVADPSNRPGGRDLCCYKWKDKDGNFWMYGCHGIGYYSNGIPDNVAGVVEDLWKYDLTANNWIWMSGDTAVGVGKGGQWGASCSLSNTNSPSSRLDIGNGMCWTDACGNFWMFGDDITYLPGFEIPDTNGLLFFNPDSNQWAWAGNMTTPQYYGTKGVSSPSNQPGQRAGGVGWKDNSGNLWMGFGVETSVGIDKNDLWRFVIDTSCNHSGNCVSIVPPPVCGFQSSDSVFCENDCINFTDLSSGSPISWAWTFNGATPSSSAAQNPQNICYQTSGVFSVTLIASNSGGSDSITFSNYINVVPAPPTPVITQSNDTLFCSFDSTYTAYQWYDDTTLVPGATKTYYVATHNGNYNVAVNNESGCLISVGINVTITGISPLSLGEGLGVRLYPNPAHTQLLLSLRGGTTKQSSTIDIYNVLGQSVLSLSLGEGRGEAILDVSGFANGLYILQLTSDEIIYRTKFIKE